MAGAIPWPREMDFIVKVLNWFRELNFLGLGLTELTMFYIKFGILSGLAAAFLLVAYLSLYSHVASFTIRVHSKLYLWLLHGIMFLLWLVSFSISTFLLVPLFALVALANCSEDAWALFPDVQIGCFAGVHGTRLIVLFCLLTLTLPYALKLSVYEGDIGRLVANTDPSWSFAKRLKRHFISSWLDKNALGRPEQIGTHVLS